MYKKIDTGIKREYYYLIQMTNNASTDCGVISFDEYKKEMDKKEKREK